MSYIVMHTEKITSDDNLQISTEINIIEVTKFSGSLKNFIFSIIS
mgnify:CR=1 FL=1